MGLFISGFFSIRHSCLRSFVIHTLKIYFEYGLQLIEILRFEVDSVTWASPESPFFSLGYMNWKIAIPPGNIGLYYFGGKDHKK